MQDVCQPASLHVAAKVHDPDASLTTMQSVHQPSSLDVYAMILNPGASLSIVTDLTLCLHESSMSICIEAMLLTVLC